MTTFAEKMAAQKATERPAEDVVVTLGGELVTLRLSEIQGDKWADISARCPVRVDAPIDLHYGYNVHAACRIAAPLSGELVGEGPLSDEDWTDLFAVLSGHELGLIVDAIYELNVYAPAKRVAALKKAFAALTASETTSN